MSEQSELIQKSIIRDMSEGVMVIGLDGTIQYFNPAAEYLLGKNKEELEDKKIASLFFGDKRNDLFNQTILDAITDESSVHYNLIPYYTDSGTKTLYVMSSFLHNDVKKVALIVILNDMTSVAVMRKRYEEQIFGLMDSLVQALSEAIDERSHYTACHTQNMVKMAEAFLNWLDQINHSWKFDEKKKHAFLMSVWLHDVGKLSVPLKVMDKATRLGNAIERIEEKFDHVHLLDKISMLEGRISSDEFEDREKNRAEWLSFIKRINTTGFLSDEDMKEVEKLSGLSYVEEDNTEHSLLTEYELDCLRIRKGTLTDEERTVMKNHAIVTRRILQKVDFPPDFDMVPEWASSHHELLNGSGYPDQKEGEEISREVCLLTILDIFEALTAKDRPYKKPIPTEKAWNILHSMADEGCLDKNTLNLFEISNTWSVIV